MSSVGKLLAQIQDDWRNHGRDWTKPGFRAIAVHRFGVWRMGINPKPLRAPFSLLYRLLYRRCRNHYGIELPYSVSVGWGVIIEHQGGIVVHGSSVIGDGCVLRQNCTLGIRRMDAIHEAPRLGNSVELGAGAVLLGGVTIGDRARIGANAVVLDDVPEGALAIGVPARSVVIDPSVASNHDK
jgi:serine O-acetyltransferase